MQKPSWRERLNYRFDNFMDKGTLALIAGLGLLSFAVILIAGTVLYLARIRPSGESELSFADAVWGSLMRTLDPGTMGGDTGWSFRLVAFAVTLGGIFIISALIGVLTGGLDERMQQLRKGRSRVLESGHTIILGWSPQVFSIIKELVSANANQPRSCIVILGNKDKLEMEEAIRSEVGPTGKTRVVCRSGEPISMLDYDLSIVSEMLDLRNRELAEITQADVFIVSDALVSLMLAQIAENKQLNAVFTDLFDPEGSEVYLKPAADYVQLGVPVNFYTVVEAARRRNEVAIGYREKAKAISAEQQYGVTLNPAKSRQITFGAKDRIVVLAET